VIRRWRRMGDTYDPPRLFVGETSVDRVEDLIPFYGSGDELQLAFNFPFIESPFESGPLSAVVELISGLLPEYAWPVWTGSNHDVSRLATRWAEGHPQKTRVALMMVLSLKGTPVLYEGDEIGLEDAEVEREELLDPVGVRFWPYYKGRDPERSPMPWQPGPNGGFTDPGVKTWLPMTDPDRCNVADQMPEPGSVLHLVRDLIALRRSTPDLTLGGSVHVAAPEGCWVWRRGEKATVALNLSEVSVDIGSIVGRVAICTDRSRDGEAVSVGLNLAAWSGAIVLND
jgi:alpha-glucosidase